MKKPPDRRLPAEWRYQEMTNSPRTAGRACLRYYRLGKRAVTVGIVEVVTAATKGASRNAQLFEDGCGPG